MTIGEALKEERKKLGLSKYKFCQGIIDRKFYGKVESGESQIGSEALVRLLFKHKIDFDEFSEKISGEYADEKDIKLKKLNIEIELAVRQKDISKIENISKKFKKLDENGIDYLRSLVFLKYLKNETMDQALLDKIEHELDRHDDISMDIQAIRLFSNSLPLLNTEQIDYFMRIILNKIKKRELSKEDNIRIAQLCNNCLKTCIERNLKLSNIQIIYDYLENLNDPELLIYKILGRRDYYLLINKDEEAKQLSNTLHSFGYYF